MTTRLPVEVRRLTEDDLEFVRVLRNANRRWFLHSEPITPDAHRRWFRTIEADAQVTFYLLWIDGRRAGTFSLTDRGDVVVVGNLLLARPYRGTGLMTAALSRMIKPDRTYLAEVKPDNDRSLAVFTRLGFHPSHVVMTRRRSENESPLGRPSVARCHSWEPPG